MWFLKVLVLIAVTAAAIVTSKALVYWVPWVDWLALDFVIMFGSIVFTYHLLFPEPPVVCKYCGTEQPRWRRYQPRDREQSRWYWTDCPGCGREVNRWGEQVKRFPQR